MPNPWLNENKSTALMNYFLINAHDNFQTINICTILLRLTRQKNPFYKIVNFLPEVALWMLCIW